MQPLDGWLIDRLGPRVFISAAGVLCGLGWAGLGLRHVAADALRALRRWPGIGAAFVYSGSMGSALKWFTDRRGLAAGIIAAGFGGGTALFIPFIASMIQHAGLSARRSSATGIFQGVVILVVAQFLRHPPRSRDGAAGAASAAGRSSGQHAVHDRARCCARRSSTCCTRCS